MNYSGNVADRTRIKRGGGGGVAKANPGAALAKLVLVDEYGRRGCQHQSLPIFIHIH